jgi:hypothetical protein
MLLIGICLLSWALVGSFIGCSSEKKEIDPPVVGPAAGSGPMGGGDTQKITLLANPSETVPVPTGQQGIINVTALVENRIGQPMPDGTAVYWSTTIGTLSASTGSVSNGSSDVTLTFPESYTGCSYVTARSGDVQATIKVCVEEVIFTPTPAPAPTATPAAAATATPLTGTLEFIVPSTPSITYSCTAGTETLDVTVLAATGGIPENGTPITFMLYGSGIAPLPATALNTGSGGTVSYQFTSCTVPAPPPASTTMTLVVSTPDGRTASLVVTITNP